MLMIQDVICKMIHARLSAFREGSLDRWLLHVVVLKRILMNAHFEASHASSLARLELAAEVVKLPLRANYRATSASDQIFAVPRDELQHFVVDLDGEELAIIIVVDTKLEASPVVILPLFDCEIASDSMTEEIHVKVVEDQAHLLLEDLLHFFHGCLLVVGDEASTKILGNINLGDFYCFQILQLVVPIVLGVLSDSSLDPINVCPKIW